MASLVSQLMSSYKEAEKDNDLSLVIFFSSLASFSRLYHNSGYANSGDLSYILYLVQEKLSWNDCMT